MHRILAAQARSTPRRESCAVLVGWMTDRGPTVTRVVPTPNVHRRPESNFLVSPLAFVEIDADAALRGWEVCGIAHSHLKTRAVPSPADLDMMTGDLIPEGWMFPIHSKRWGETRVWTVRGGAVIEIVPDSAS